MSDRPPGPAFPIAVAFGTAMFVGLRVPLLVEAYSYDAVGDVGGSAAWLARSIPMIMLPFLAAVGAAVVSVRDGARLWWLPSVAFLVLGTPVERWLGYDSLLVRSTGPFIGMAADLIAVLIPAFVFARTVNVERREVGRDRLLAGAIVLAAYLSWVLPRSLESADPAAGSVALVFLLAVCWRTESLTRKVAFVAIALAASKLVAYLIFEGPGALGAGLLVSLDVVVITVGGLLIAPIARLIGRGTARVRLAA